MLNIRISTKFPFTSSFASILNCVHKCRVNPFVLSLFVVSDILITREKKRKGCGLTELP